MNPRHLLQGRLGERLACRRLLGCGYDVLVRRYRTSRGEIDVVAFEGETLVFIEVKTRASRVFGEPWEFVDRDKRRRMKDAAAEFMARYDLGDCRYRFDVVSVVAPGTDDEEVVVLRNVF